MLPQFEKRLIENVVQPHVEKYRFPSYGVVLAFDPQQNKASIVIASSGSEEASEVLYNVPVPMQLGIQSVAPLIGMECCVVFKDGNSSYPMITHFYNRSFENQDYSSQYKALDPIPDYMLR